MRFGTTFFLLLLALPLRAQPVPGDCAHGTAEGVLDVNDVRASLFNNGNLFYGPTGGGQYVEARYAVPKDAACGPNGELSCTALYAGNLWVGGQVDGALRTAAATFTGYEFWPGPLGPGATPPDDCAEYDRVWVVSRADVARYLTTGEATADLREWPHHLGAPVLDGDGIEGNYDLEGGDQPAVYGDQTAWWVMNDVGNVHPSGGTPPIGLEVQVTAFARASPIPALDQATLYRFVLVNRSAQPLDSAFVAFWWDTDLGDAQDDYLGTDTTRGMVYAYNDGPDYFYRATPPALGALVLDGPTGADGAPLGLSASMTLLNGGPPGASDPQTAEAFYHVLRGRWTDGTPVTASGFGYRTDGPVTPFMLPGDPVTDACWSALNPCEGDLRLAPANRRGVASVGPFLLDPAEADTLAVALVFGRGADPLASITELRAAADVVRFAYDTGRFEPQLVTGSGSGSDDEAPSALRLLRPRPNPFVDALALRYEVPAPVALRLSVYDALGREVAVLADGTAEAGVHEAAVDGAALAPGVYFVRLAVPGGSRTLAVTRSAR